MKRVAYLVEVLVGLAAIVPARILRRFGTGRRSVVVTGWYGSETIGDIAILGQTIREIRDVAPDAAISVASFDVAHTVRSLADLAERNVAVVTVGGASAWRQARATALLYGGGPLMESPSMLVWAARALLARAAGARVVVYACGVGPLRSLRSKRAVALLARASHLVILRDDVSAATLGAVAGHRRSIVTFDPAFDYVRDQRRRGNTSQKVAVALRMPAPAYLGLTESDRQAWAAGFLDAVAEVLDSLAERNMVLEGVVMYAHDDENDRNVLESVRRRMRNRDALHVAPGRHGLRHVISVVSGADVVFSVRFHGMIFSLGLEKPFVAVDYARPAGKVSAAAELADVTHRVVPIDALVPADVVARITAAAAEPPAPIPARLHAAAPTRRRALAAVLAGQAGAPQDLTAIDAGTAGVHGGGVR